MKKIIFILLVGIVGLGYSQEWSMDSNHSRLQFTVKHLSISDVEGSVRDFTVMLNMSDKDFSTAKIEVSGSVNSIDTDNSMRDEHIKGDEFFDVAKYPSIKFVSSSVSKKGDHYALKGYLTMHGMRKMVDLEMFVTGPILNPRDQKKTIGMVVIGVINRKDFGIGQDTSSMMIGDEVKIEANMEFKLN